MGGVLPFYHAEWRLTDGCFVKPGHENIAQAARPCCLNPGGAVQRRLEQARELRAPIAKAGAPRKPHVTRPEHSNTDAPGANIGVDLPGLSARPQPLAGPRLFSR